MTDLTPSPKQLQSWIDKISHPNEQGVGPSLKDKELACLAFRAGADQELEACCEVLNNHNPSGYYGEILRTRRRPKPPSLKYQALKSLGHINRGIDRPEDTDIIRRALEQLDD